MAKLINKTTSEIRLSSGHTLPRLGELVTTNDVIRGDNWMILQGMVLSGAVVAELDADAEPDTAPQASTAPAKAKASI